METTECDLCGSEKASPKFVLSDWLLERNEVVTQLVQCDECRLIYQNPRPTLTEMADHYPPEYESYLPHPERRKASWLLRRAIQYGINKRCRLVTRHKRAGRLLDVGCAAGVFLRGMQGQGAWELYGVDISEYAARIAQAQHQLNVHIGTLEEAAFPDAFFDVVTLWDVLEHLHRPAVTLREIHRLLKPEGLVIIRVPNGESIDAKVFQRYWAGLDAPRHLYVFSPQTLRELLEKNGFDVVDVIYGASWYTTLLLSLRFWFVARGISARIKDPLLKVLYHPVMRLLTAPLFFVGGLVLPGPLIITTAVKSQAN